MKINDIIFLGGNDKAKQRLKKWLKLHNTMLYKNFDTRIIENLRIDYYKKFGATPLYLYLGKEEVENFDLYFSDHKSFKIKENHNGMLEGDREFRAMKIIELDKPNFLAVGGEILEYKPDEVPF